MPCEECATGLFYFAKIDGEVGKSHTSQSSSGAKTWQAPDQGSPFIKQVTANTFF